jgi:hypothetical protein
MAGNSGKRSFLITKGHYFDVVQKKYDTLSVKTGKVKVKKGDIYLALAIKCL